MKIGFVVEPYEESHASGMGYSVMETMRHLPLVAPEQQFIFYSSRPISDTILPTGSTNVLMPRGFIKQFFWFLRLRKKDVDVLLFVAPLLPLSISPKIYTIVLCKDLASYTIQSETITERIKLFIRDRLLMPRCLARASKIAVPSEATKHDLMTIYGIPQEKIAITYEGFQDFSDCKEEPIDHTLVPYFFFTGKVKYRKNVHGIAAAFVAFKKRTNADCRLIISGDYGGSYYEDVMHTVREGGVEKDVHFVGYVSKGQLKNWYTHALAVVFPSFNEGFGMPIIEAMSLGTPVITSNISSMTEIAGDAALLVDPADAEDISRAMETMYTDSKVRAMLSVQGRTRAVMFSWASTVRRYAALFPSI